MVPESAEPEFARGTLGAEFGVVSGGWRRDPFGLPSPWLSRLVAFGAGPPGVVSPGVDRSGVDCPGDDWPGVDWPGVDWPGVGWPGVCGAGVEVPGLGGPGVGAPGVFDSSSGPSRWGRSGSGIWGRLGSGRSGAVVADGVRSGVLVGSCSLVVESVAADDDGPTGAPVAVAAFVGCSMVELGCWAGTVVVPPLPVPLPVPSVVVAAPVVAMAGAGVVVTCSVLLVPSGLTGSSAVGSISLMP